MELIQQLRQKLAVHLPSSPPHDKLNDGCLLLQVAAAHGKKDVLPAAQHCFTEADLICQVIVNCSQIDHSAVPTTPLPSSPPAHLDP